MWLHKEYYGLNCEHKILNSTIFKNSTILTQEQSLQLVNLAGFSLNLNWTLLYQASRDGFSTSSFHSKCDGKYMHTLVVAKTNLNLTQQFIFGGYTEADWSVGGYDSNAFLFSLINAYNIPVKMNVSKPQNAIVSAPYYGPNFSVDLAIDFDVNFSNLGDRYSVPSFVPNSTNDYQTFLAGSFHFTPIEVEVYAIYFDRKFIYKFILIIKIYNYYIKINSLPN